MTGPVRVEVCGKVRTAKRAATERMLAVAGIFGIGVEAGAERILFEKISLSVEPGEVMLITGASGAGKSTLLAALETALRPHASITRLEQIPVPGDCSVVDCFGGGASLEWVLACLARAGLSEARVLFQSPAELSEGQRFRYRLAQFFAGDGDILIADEFGATLDRVTARVVSFQLAKFIRASRKTDRPRAAIIATTHEDLVDDLTPSKRLYVRLNGDVEIFQ
jgi:uncharacterized protein